MEATENGERERARESERGRDGVVKTRIRVDWSGGMIHQFVECACYTHMEPSGRDHAGRDGLSWNECGV